MTDARDKAIAAMSKAVWVDQDGFAYRVNAGEMLDAIPADVLVDLATERATQDQGAGTQPAPEQKESTTT